MAHTRDWLSTSPIDHTLNKNWPGEDRKVRVDVEERLKDQQYGFTPGETNDGIKRLEFREQADNPGAGSDVLRLYGKAVSDKTMLFMQDEDGNVGQVFGFRSGDMLFSSNTTTPPGGWTDVSSTYDDEFIRVSSGATLQTSTMPVEEHAHGLNNHTHSTPNHVHTLKLNPTDGATRRSGIETYSGSAGTSSSAHFDSSGAGTSGAASGNTENAGTTTAYRTLRMYKKD